MVARYPSVDLSLFIDLGVMSIVQDNKCRCSIFPFSLTSKIFLTLDVYLLFFFLGRSMGIHAAWLGSTACSKQIDSHDVDTMM